MKGEESAGIGRDLSGDAPRYKIPKNLSLLSAMIVFPSAGISLTVGFI